MPGKGVFIFTVATQMVLVNVFALWQALANGLLYIVIILIGLIVLYSFLAGKTVIGRHVYALGGNAKTAELSGIDTKTRDVPGLFQHGTAGGRGRNRGGRAVQLGGADGRGRI